MKIAHLAGLLALCAMFGVGCETSGPSAAAPEDLQPTGAAATQGGDAFGFLVTNYAPLEQWMDERFKVRYENMPLHMVFEQQPISDIRYKTENLPQSTPVFNLVSTSISRREILKEISDFFNLDMTVEMANGQPSHVVVRGRQASSGGYVPPAPANTFSATQPSEYFSPDPALR